MFKTIVPDRRPRWLSWCLALLLTLLMAACATKPQSDLSAFPPLPNDQPPGASALAVNTAKNLGRGINFGNMLESPVEGSWGLSVTNPLVDAAASAGFNTVRLPVRWSNHAQADRPFALDITFTRRVENVVDALLAKGFYVVLNMHHYRHLDGDAPDKDDAAQVPELADERFLALWQQIAFRFKGRSERLVFELYNEPHGRLDAARWNDLAARALAVVRASNPNRVVMLGPVGWNKAEALKSLRLPNDPHLIATIHNYEPFKFTHQGAFWVQPELPTGVSCCDATQQAELTAPLDLAKAWSVQTRYPVYVGEFGAFKSADMNARVEYTRLARQQIEARGFTWAYWELASNFGVYDLQAKAFHAPLLQALMGPDAAPASALPAAPATMPAASSTTAP